MRKNKLKSITKKDLEKLDLEELGVLRDKIEEVAWDKKNERAIKGINDNKAEFIKE